jgi:hypothetical protein
MSIEKIEIEDNEDLILSIVEKINEIIDWINSQ